MYALLGLGLGFTDETKTFIGWLGDRVKEKPAATPTRGR
ncbi:hypothetical protein [Streptomyces goshikiensis]